MKIVIGTANFYKKYGLLNNQISNKNELKKLFNFLTKKKIFFLDTAFLYHFDAFFALDYNLQKFKIITKIKLKRFIKN